MEQSAVEAQKVLGQVSAQAIADGAFRRRLAAEPAAGLREHGLELPAELLAEFRVEFVDAYDRVPAGGGPPDTLYLVVAAEVDELSHEELAMVAGAAASCQSTGSSVCSVPSTLSSTSTASTNSCA
jgi:hypothetical protein